LNKIGLRQTDAQHLTTKLKTARNHADIRAVVRRTYQAINAGFAKLPIEPKREMLEFLLAGANGTRRPSSPVSEDTMTFWIDKAQTWDELVLRAAMVSR
jgi:hypothetical protein